MPLSGGASDKLGNRYEAWWTADQIIHLLKGKADSIRIEDPVATKAEFVVNHQNRREFHQTKRSNPEGKWSLSALHQEGLPLAMFNALAGNGDEFIFASTSDAPELRELSERARQAASEQEFQSVFLAAKDHKDNFNKLLVHWNNPSISTAYGVLRRIYTRSINEFDLREKVERGLQVLFLEDIRALCAVLHDLIDSSIHQTLTTNSVFEFLSNKGYKRRRLIRPSAAPELIKDATDRYLEQTRCKLIQGKLVRRSISQKLLDAIANATAGSDFVLTGTAGTGKTGCIIELVEGLQARQTPVLAFRLDRLEPVTSTTNLGKQLDLEESPALVLATASQNAVLIVDQLDAVSASSGRNINFTETISDLIIEARELGLHTVVVCRTFDWENDRRLRRLLSVHATRTDIGSFSVDETKTSLQEEGFRPDLFHARQLELLQLPQNLSLFLDAGFSPTKAPRFSTAKELFDIYWDEKRTAIRNRAPSLAEQWNEIIGVLCERMASTQQLSVVREKLDRFSSGYLAQMVSEGVLSFDGKRYGFGHESFFDYCFARGFVENERPLVDWLLSSKQHLFQRAQVRQILTYLRDADRTRYCEELQSLLSHREVRTHLKELALALLARVPEPGNDEWSILEPWINSELVAFELNRPNPDKLATLVWRHFFSSDSWFSLVYQKGIVAEWLASSNEYVANMATRYVHFNQRHSGDQAAELLEPYVGQGGVWTQRLRSAMESATYENSRRFFDLFLRLIDDGTLDDAKERFASNGTFWLMLYGLGKEKPDWLPEVAARWLRRRAILVQKQKSDSGRIPWRDIFAHEGFGVDSLLESASKAPSMLLEHLLPAVLDVADMAAYDKQTAPKHDHVWPLLFEPSHLSLDDAYIRALELSIESLAKKQPEQLTTIVEKLKNRESHLANVLLLQLYQNTPALAEEAIELLCCETSRLACGYADSPYWITAQTIKALTPNCSSQTLARLEEKLLNYSPDYERSSKRRNVGWASYNLLCAIPENRRSRQTQSRFLGLHRKYGDTLKTPHKIEIHEVVSPIPAKATDRMTDKQWLKAIKKYTDDDEHVWKEDFSKGGPAELANALEGYVRKDPERFSKLSLCFPLGTNPVYFDRVLRGLKDTKLSASAKLDVCRKAYLEARVECGGAIAELLGSIEDNLPEDALEMLHWIATQHPDPDKDPWDPVETDEKPHSKGDMLFQGINTVRGHAAWAVRDLIWRSAGYIPKLLPTIEAIIKDKSLAVRSCAASTIIPLINSDVALAISLFRELTSADERLLETRDVELFLYYGVRKHFAELRSHIEVMLRSSISGLNQAGARLACLAFLHKQGASDLVEEAKRGSASHRRGIAEIAARNLAQADCRPWCEERLLELFQDPESTVRGKAARCFSQLEKEPLCNYNDLIRAFCQSPAFETNSASIIHLLEKSTNPLPSVTVEVCANFLARFSHEAKDTSTHRAADVYTISKVILRTYQQYQHEQWGSRCLDLIDQMCREGIHAVKSDMDSFER